MKKIIENIRVVIHFFRKRIHDRRDKWYPLYPIMLGETYTIFDFILHRGHEGVDQTPNTADYIPFSYRFHIPLAFEVEDYENGGLPRYKTIRVRAVGLLQHPDRIFELIRDKDTDTQHILEQNIVMRLAENRKWKTFRFYGLSEREFIKALEKIERYHNPAYDNVTDYE